MANDIEIASGAYDEKEFIVFSETDLVSTDGKNRWQEGIDEWLKTQSDPKYHPPTETSGDRLDTVVMNITDPQDKKQYDDHDVKVAGEAFSSDSISEINVEILGTQAFSDKVTGTNSYSRVFNLNTGTYTIKMTAKDNRGKETTGEVKIGVLVAWDSAVAPTPSPSASPLLL